MRNSREENRITPEKAGKSRKSRLLLKPEKEDFRAPAGLKPAGACFFRQARQPLCAL
jgi:hypothetical protein